MMVQFLDLTLTNSGFDMFTTKDGRKHWLLDSASSTHVSCDKREFSTLTIYETPYYLTVGGGHRLEVVGVGDVRKLLDCNGDPCWTLIKDVKYVPGMGANLFSVTCFTDKGFGVWFAPDSGRGSVIDKDGNLLMTTTKHFKQNVVDMGNSVEDDASKETIVLFNNLDNVYFNAGELEVPKPVLLHQRLGHIGIDKLRRLGLKVDSIGICEPCILAKAHRQNHKGPATRAELSYEKLHCDTAGSIKPAAIETGAKYFNIIVDDASRFRWITGIELKSEVYRVISNFVQKATKDGHVIKAIHCDHGGEYNSNIMKNFCHKEAINLTFSSVGTPEQNGLAEKAIRDVVASAKANLFHCGLPPCFWEFALNYACH